MRSRIQQALVITTSALAIALMSQSPGSAGVYLADTAGVDVCTAQPTPDLPYACACVDTPTCTFSIYPHYGTGISTPVGQACRIMPTQVKNALSAGEPRVENPCHSFPSPG